jgi:hypothetical protein
MDSPPQPPDFDPQKVKDQLAQSHAALVAKVEAAAAIVDAEYAFQSLVMVQLMTMNEGFEEAKHGDIPALVELAAFHLYPRFGQSTDRDPEKIQAAMDALKELNDMRSLHTAFSVETADLELAELQVHLQLWAETVRGSAYASQIRRLIEQIQGPFEAWFRAKTGIGPLRSLQVIAAFESIIGENIRAHGQRMRSLRPRMESQMSRLAASPPPSPELKAEGEALAKEFMRFLEDACVVMPCGFTQLVEKIPDFTRGEWDGLMGLVGLTPASRAKLQRAREVNGRPLYFLSGDRIICVGTSVLDALFEAYDQATRTDMPFRDKRYVPNLSGWMEGEVRDYLLRLFPASAVYHQLTYPEPDKPGGETELDVAVSWGPFLVLVEVKGKQFRPRSRLGDPARLRDDLKDNIEEAFDQAARVMRYLEANPTATFTEKGTGRKLTVRSDALRRVFPMSVTLHHFGGLATQLALLKRIGLFKDSAYPWSVSLPDLDVIARFAGSPDVFLHYVQRRLDLQRSEKNVTGDELDVFGLYLDSRLHPSQFWDRTESDGRAFTMMRLDGGSARFDAWYQAEEDSRVKKPEIKLELPPRFSAIIDGLRRGTDDGARWIAFALLGLSPDAVGRIEADLEKLRATAPPPGKFLRMTFKDGDLAVSLVMGDGANPMALHKQTIFRASLEKYRMKCSASVALGLDYGDPTKAYDCAIWMEGPWAQDPVMEEMLAGERTKAVARQKLPGRNDPCLCGSGRKFKKCCIDKVRVLPPEAD